MKTDLFQSCGGHCWVFQIWWHIECNTFTASSFRIWDSLTGIPSLPLVLFVVMLPKAHLTSHSLQPHGPQPARLLCPCNSPGKNTGVGCHSLLQGIFPTQGLNLGLPHWRQMLYHLSHQGSPSTCTRHWNRKNVYGMYLANTLAHAAINRRQIVSPIIMSTKLGIFYEEMCFN